MVIAFQCIEHAILIAQHVLPLAAVIAVQVVTLPTINGKGLIDAAKLIVLVEGLEMVQVEDNMLHLIILADIAIHIVVGAHLGLLLLLVSHANLFII